MKILHGGHSTQKNIDVGHSTKNIIKTLGNRTWEPLHPLRPRPSRSWNPKHHISQRLLDICVLTFIII